MFIHRKSGDNYQFLNLQLFFLFVNDLLLLPPPPFFSHLSLGFIVESKVNTQALSTIKFCGDEMTLVGSIFESFLLELPTFPILNIPTSQTFQYSHLSVSLTLTPEACSHDLF